MNDAFRALVDKLPSLMSQLSNATLRPWNKLGQLPARGIYVFYENNVPIYVGRTNRMRKSEILEIQTEYMGIAEDLEDDYDISKYLDWE